MLYVFWDDGDLVVRFWYVLWGYGLLGLLVVYVFYWKVGRRFEWDGGCVWLFFCCWIWILGWCWGDCIDWVILVFYWNVGVEYVGLVFGGIDLVVGVLVVGVWGFLLLYCFWYFLEDFVGGVVG